MLLALRKIELYTSIPPQGHYRKKNLDPALQGLKDKRSRLRVASLHQGRVRKIGSPSLWSYFGRQRSMLYIDAMSTFRGPSFGSGIDTIA